MFKKGSLSLSINAIVVLILAVTMLGLGLMFMQNMMGGAMGQLGDVSREVENQMRDRLQEGGREIEIRTQNIEVAPASTQTEFLAIRNTRDNDLSFNMEFHCGQTMENADLTDVGFSFFSSTFLEQGESIVLDFKISPNSRAVMTTYECAIFVDLAEGSSAELTQAVGHYTTNQGEQRFNELITANLYASRRFNVVLKR